MQATTARSHAVAFTRFPSALLADHEEDGNDLAAFDTIGTVVSLPMTRGDIADYLGLTTETVSRIFSQFKTQGVIQIRASSEVVLRSRDTLEDLADAA